LNLIQTLLDSIGADGPSPISLYFSFRSSPQFLHCFSFVSSLRLSLPWSSLIFLAISPCLPVRVFQDRPPSRLVEFTAKTLSAASVSNPVSSLKGQEQPLATQTLPQRTVYHTLQADLKSMMNNIQTREQLDDFRERLGQVG
jgi:hypothetical protein